MLTIDQGTIHARASVPPASSYPHPGWVEQSANAPIAAGHNTEVEAGTARFTPQMPAGKAAATRKTWREAIHRVTV